MKPQEAASTTAQDDNAARRYPAWRHFVLTTANRHDYRLHQGRMVQYSYVFAIALLWCAQLAYPTVDPDVLLLWLAESLTNLALRLGLLLIVFDARTDCEVAKAWCRAVPVLDLLIVGAHWVWTGLLFMEPAWTFGTFSTVLVFLLMSVAVVTYTPAWITATLYLLSMWVPVTIVLWPATLDRMGPFGVTFVGVLALLCLGVYTTQRQLRRYLDKVAQVRQLVSQLASSNGELTQLRAEAHASLQVRSQFFAGASHDFAQRLHALKLLAHTARSSAGEGADPALSMLTGAVTDLENYAREVLAFARFESGEIFPQPAAIHLQDVFQRLALHFEVVAEDRGVGLRVRSTTAELETDPGLLQRLLENLVGNAIKFTRRDVLLAARRDGAGWRIEVWDQGPGIAPESLQHIFVAFYQTHPAAQGESGSGLGLGLAIARRLAAALDCEIAVRSRVGRGSVFIVRVP